MNKLYTAQEVADKLKIKKTTVYELIKRGELASSKIGKQLRISDEQLNSYIRGSEPETLFPSYEYNFQPESSLLKRDYLLNSNGLILSGQTSPALELLCSQMAVHPNGLPVLQSHLNTYNGLYSLYFGKVHIASASIEETAIPALAPGMSLAVICLYDYSIGLYVKKGNPKSIHSIHDLSRADIILANREKGSTSRMFLDKQLCRYQLQTSEISGYKKELVSDLSTAALIINGKADTAIGEEYISHQSAALDFIPLKDMPMYLVMETDSLEKPGFPALLEIIRSDDFKTSVYNQTGYNMKRTGNLNRVGGK